MNIQTLLHHCSLSSRYRGLLGLLAPAHPTHTTLLASPPEVSTRPELTQPLPTWPCACALCAHAQLPRSSIHCGCCPASVPLLQSQPWTGPWSYWCCFLHRIRTELMVRKKKKK